MSKSKITHQQTNAIAEPANSRPRRKAKEEGTIQSTKADAPSTAPRARAKAAKPISEATKKAAHVSKHDQVLQLLRGKQGASIEEMQTATGWQSHSVRGFLSGTVKKKLGLKLRSSKSKNGERRYSVAG